MEQAPVPQQETIELPEDREPLQKKLEEYTGRFDIYTAPEQQLDTIYKIAVLEPLVTNGVVNRAEVRAKLKKEHGSLDEDTFRNAWGVINDYVQTGGRKLRGGTGLPRPQEDTDLDQL